MNATPIPCPIGNFPDADEMPAKGDRYLVTRIGEIAAFGRGYLPLGMYEIVEVTADAIIFLPVAE